MAKLSPRDIKRKIQGIKNTKRITNAMKVVSAAKLRKAQELVYASRPYSEKLYELVGHLAAHVDTEDNPLFDVREERNVDVILVTADRGLAGAFNSNVIRTAENLIREKEEKGVKVSLILVGRKGFQYFTKRGYNVIKGYDEVFRKTVNFNVAKEVAEIVKERFLNGETDRVYLINNEMVTRASYKPQVRVFLPFEAQEKEVEELGTYEFEVSEEEFFDYIVNLYLNYQVYRAMVESNAAEHFARMIAMDNATKNAEDLIRQWTLVFNKARQEAITTELIDITNAVEALKAQ
ncbi:F0F1 ATP synthase subunit gamma [Aquifex aeolicus]|uniref:ATP synthase gamma chain n=1 Tax=Aquifex aeolicus (strain VF5) TaxID=224324 RepID=ATPG_AQUAE|nr:F0F1 ATP synthase subunit gamma [Aquifex aeolicus]O67829.1 RecName: Full=ATP synthase gamma chain; AltName: Full=ATP synthase F1 sector gamma subunit; AltName: Full=F-ATPase gamma subunit [Aquifex aeolicus VF5]AAC07791.1 ATP synthase F1 gamma subunit [Aquifex aeolicus VF5]